MKRLLFTFALALASLGAAHAQLAPPSSAPTKQQATPQDAPDESKLQTHNHYRNKAGQEVHSPSKSTDGKIPAGASAQCRDGSYSFSKNHRGTCSHHGGVASWL